MKKHILDLKRLRRVPAQFSWVDHQLIRSRLLCGADSASWALYLFLVTVGDEQGLSYYCDASLCSHLNLSDEGLGQARGQLLERSLIAWEAPLYQVLCIQRGQQRVGDFPSSESATLPGQEVKRKTRVDAPAAMSAQERHINGLRMAKVLREMMKAGNQ